MTSAPAAGGGGAGVLAPAPCTPEEFDIFWEKVEELELQDVLQCIGDDLSGAGGCLTQAEWPVGGKANFLQQERLVGRMRSAGIHIADLPVDASLKRKDRAWWKATGVPLLTRVRAKLGAAAAGSRKISAGMFDGHILRREESDKVVQHPNFAVFEAAVGRGDFTQARSLLAVDRVNEFGWLLQRAVLTT